MKSEIRFLKTLERIPGHGTFQILLLGKSQLTNHSETKDYLSYMKYLAPRWPHLQVLVDFMEVGTIPTRWCRFPEEKEYRDQSPRYTYPREESCVCLRSANITTIAEFF